ncbi:MAG: helix-turn-helix domain-containing protein [Acidimicrobiales bacterium]
MAAARARSHRPRLRPAARRGRARRRRPHVGGPPEREFRRAYGEPPYAYLTTRRIERAMTLLRRGDLSVTEVCVAVGFSSLGSFSSRFTELVGTSPSEYRRQAAPSTAGIPACVAKQFTRPVRNREASAVGRP